MNILQTTCLGGVISAAVVIAQGALIAQETPDARSKTVPAPVVHVYVSLTPKGSSVNEVVGYSAATNGSLTAVPGSPFTADLGWLASNTNSLFGVNENGIDIDSYAIEANGSLRLTNQTDVAGLNDNDCGSSVALFTDRTGTTVYDLDFNDSNCANNDYRTLEVASNGVLKSLAMSQGNAWLTVPASFIGNNQYAYAASCLSDMYWGIWGYSRASSGVLTDLTSFSAPVPTAPTGDFYCPSLTAADSSNHLAIAMQAVDDNFNPAGAPQIATYTAASNGSLSTESTIASMPKVSVVNVTDLKMSPAGNLLAVSGTGGLQVLHFNGASPATSFTSLLTTVEIDQMFWDNANHLYAISRTTGKLYVFTITPTSATAAPGSPYTVTGAQNLTLQW